MTLLETWGGLRVVPDYVVAERDSSSLRLNAAVTVADLTSNLAVEYGVTSEIFTTTDYGMTQLWASAFHHAGFGGIRYWARHDLAHTAACVALFGPADPNYVTCGTRGGGDALTSSDRHELARPAGAAKPESPCSRCRRCDHYGSESSPAS